MLFILLILLFLLQPNAYSTTQVVQYFTHAPVSVCQPSDSNSSCGGGGSGGNVGIGTAGWNAIYAANGSTVTASSVLQTVGNNVGIGSATPGQVLDIQGSARATGFIGNGSLLTNIPTTVSNSDGTLTISPTTGAVVGSLALSHTNTWTGQQIFNTANVGIGTATPGQLLDIQGTARMLGFYMKPGASNNYVLTSDPNGNGAWAAAASGSGTVNSGTANQAAYYASSTTAVSGTSNLIFNGSNIGIGSATPGQLLDIQGSVRILPAGSTLSIGTINNTNYLNVGTTAQFNVSSTGTVASGAITSTGAVQGTAFKTSASGDFFGATAVSSANAFSVFTGSGSTTGFTEIRNTTGAATGTDYTKITGGNNGATEIIRFMGSGNIGIGSAVPQYPLTMIVGNIGISTTNAASMQTGCNGSGVTSCVCKQYQAGFCTSCTCT